VASPAPPNILFLTCHDLGRHLHCYGRQTLHSPALDRLAAEGVRFEQAFCTSPGCSPSRGSFATGRFPHANGVMGLVHPPFDWNLHPDELHIAQILGNAGFETHLFGHQHVTTSMPRLGFHHLHGFDEVTGCHEPALGATVSQRVIDFLGGELSDRPLYIEVNLEEPHRPYNQGGAWPDDSLGVEVPGYLPPGPAAQVEMAAFQGALRHGDAGIGRILQALDDAGLTDNTLVVFAADHGIAMPRAKCTLYDPGISIALIMRWPEGEITGGRTIPEMVSGVDILPTILEAANIPIADRIQGRSFLPLLRGAPYVPRTEIYAEKSFHSYYDPMRAIRTEHYKYIRNFETAFAVEVPADVQPGEIYRDHVELYVGGTHPAVELYDLDADPLEMDNLSGSTEYADAEAELSSLLLSWMVETGDPLVHGPIPSPSYRASARLLWAQPSRSSERNSDPGPW
jgi:N-sulfoglucosamine sulfohydrolase